MMQAEVVENFALFMSKYEEEFQPYLAACLGEVWNLLMNTGAAPHQDLLVTTSIRFLTTVRAAVSAISAGAVSRPHLGHISAIFAGDAAHATCC